MQRWAPGSSHSAGARVDDPAFYFTQDYDSSKPSSLRWIAAKFKGNKMVWSYEPDAVTTDGPNEFHPEGIHLRGSYVVLVYFDWTTFRIVKLDSGTGEVVSNTPVNLVPEWLPTPVGDYWYLHGRFGSRDYKHAGYPYSREYYEPAFVPTPGAAYPLKYGGYNVDVPYSHLSFVGGGYFYGMSTVSRDSVKPAPGGMFAMVSRNLRYSDSGGEHHLDGWLKYNLLFIDEDTGDIKWALGSSYQTGYGGTLTVYDPAYNHLVHANSSGVWCAQGNYLRQYSNSDGSKLREFRYAVEAYKKYAVDPDEFYYLRPIGICEMPGGKVFVSWRAFVTSHINDFGSFPPVGGYHYAQTIIDGNGNMTTAVEGVARSSDTHHMQGPVVATGPAYACYEPVADSDGMIYCSVAGWFPNSDVDATPGAEERKIRHAKIDGSTFEVIWTTDARTELELEEGDVGWYQNSHVRGDWFGHNYFSGYFGNIASGLETGSAGRHIGKDGFLYYRCPYERTTPGRVPGVHARPLGTGKPEKRAMSIPIQEGIATADAGGNIWYPGQSYYYDSSAANDPFDRLRFPVDPNGPSPYENDTRAFYPMPLHMEVEPGRLSFM